MSQLQQYNDLTEESMSSSHEEYDDEYSEYALSAQEHWEESMKQLTMLFSIVIFPLIGKLLGRRFSKIIWRKVANWWFV